MLELNIIKTKHKKHNCDLTSNFILVKIDVKQKRIFLRKIKMLNRRIVLAFILYSNIYLFIELKSRPLRPMICQNGLK